METDGNHCIVPLCINYERIPELTALTSDAGNKLSVNGLYGWLKVSVSLSVWALGFLQVNDNRTYFMDELLSVGFTLQPQHPSK